MFKVNNRNTRTRCEICSKLAIKIPERRHVIAGWEPLPGIFYTVSVSSNLDRLSLIKNAGNDQFKIYITVDVIL